MAMEAGAFVTPNLRLTRRLGSGGMGTVWVARHVGLRCDVVVKFITGEHARNAEVVGRFNREAAAAADVKSPHVVQMLDHGLATDGLPFIAMELLEGEDLAVRLAREGSLPPGEVAGVVVQVCRALSRAHEGTGLGLPIVKKVREVQGGTFAIESEPGTGTRIMVSFASHFVRIPPPPAGPPQPPRAKATP